MRLEQVVMRQNIQIGSAMLKIWTLDSQTYSGLVFGLLNICHVGLYSCPFVSKHISSKHPLFSDVGLLWNLKFSTAELTSKGAHVFTGWKAPFYRRNFVSEGGDCRQQILKYSLKISKPRK